MPYKKILLWSLALSTPVPAWAQATTTLVTGQSTLQQVGINTSNLSGLLATVFELGISVAVVLTLIMSILGGIQYMTTDSFSGKSEGKERIVNALLGLGLALVSWLLLYVINPNLVNLNNNLLLNPPAPQTTQGSGNITTVSSSGGLSDADARNQLTAAGVTISSSGNCSDQQNSACTSLEGLPQSAVTGLIQAASACQTSGCITVTAGTEVGHNSHGPGIATVDVRYSPDALQALESTGLKESPFAGASTRGILTCEPASQHSETSTSCSSDSAGTIHVQF